MNPPELDLKRSAINVTQQPEEVIKTDQQTEDVTKTAQPSEDLASTTRVYQKKSIVYVRSQPVLDALIRMATLMFPHQRNIRQGYSFDEYPNSYSVR